MAMNLTQLHTLLAAAHKYAIAHEKIVDTSGKTHPEYVEALTELTEAAVDIPPTDYALEPHVMDLVEIAHRSFMREYLLDAKFRNTIHALAVLEKTIRNYSEFHNLQGHKLTSLALDDLADDVLAAIPNQPKDTEL